MLIFHTDIPATDTNVHTYFATLA